MLLATGCQTTKTAFQFQPAPPPSKLDTRPAVATVLEKTIAAVTPAERPVAAVPAIPRHRQAKRVRLVERLIPVPFKSASAATSYSKSNTTSKHHRPQQPQLEHTAAFLLGAALVVGGVVGGILLGGWLGLGVGALVVLLGYYFLGVGIGGKHAWLEVFQEFFNM